MDMSFDISNGAQTRHLTANFVPQEHHYFILTGKHHPLFFEFRKCEFWTLVYKLLDTRPLFQNVTFLRKVRTALRFEVSKMKNLFKFWIFDSHRESKFASIRNLLFFGRGPRLLCEPQSLQLEKSRLEFCDLFSDQVSLLSSETIDPNVRRVSDFRKLGLKGPNFRRKFDPLFFDFGIPPGGSGRRGCGIFTHVGIFRHRRR